MDDDELEARAARWARFARGLIATAPDGGRVEYGARVGAAGALIVLTAHRGDTERMAPVLACALLTDAKVGENVLRVARLLAEPMLRPHGVEIVVPA